MRQPFVFLIAALLCGLAIPAIGQDEPKVSFEQDIKPILETRCMTCHAPPNPKDGLDFSFADAVVDGYYIAEGDLDNSDFYYRMVTDDEDLMMPPPGTNNVMTRQEIALVKLWILEGADWPSEIELVNPDVTPREESKDDAEASEPKADATMLEKVWNFQGYFHPAMVHFPVALLTMAAFFVVLHWLFAGAFRDAAYYCLIFGAITSIIASAMGWALGPIQGFGTDPFNSGSSIFWHRWCGIGVSVLACIAAILAIRVRKNESESRRFKRAKKDLPWQIATFLVAGLVGLTGHQGGELVYGEKWYDDAFSLFEAPAAPITDDSETDGDDDSAADDSPDDDTTAGDEETNDSDAGADADDTTADDTTADDTTADDTTADDTTNTDDTNSDDGSSDDGSSSDGNDSSDDGTQSGGDDTTGDDTTGDQDGADSDTSDNN